MKNKNSYLITGGTGSFGKAFISHLVKSNKKISRLVIFSRDELKQYEMAQLYPVKQYPYIRFFIGDVRDEKRVIAATEGIETIIHAAALKQVPTTEYNPFEAIKTNIIGANNVIEAALINNVKNVIALSTDKACSPINLYGATKLCSDKLFISANNIKGNRKVKFSVVRYGNVVGSRASVVPLFQKLINQGSKHLPITDDKMTRFWITINQGIELVNDAFHDMRGGEIYIPKIPSIKIIHLAKAMAPNMKQKIIGIRPGEKVHETLTSKDESAYVIKFKKYYVVSPTYISISLIKKYFKNYKGEKGKVVDNNFEYNSETNEHFLNVDEIKKLNKLNIVNDTL